MKNVTLNAGGYCIIPEIKFKKPLEVKFKYDPTMLSSSEKDNDVYMYTYLKDEKNWTKLDRVDVNTDQKAVTSRASYSGDLVNATLKVPDHSDPLSYNPNSIKDIKAANPASKVNLAKVSVAGNMGDAVIGYPIEIPAGRSGMQPGVAIRYNSAGGNGWLGLGWDVAIDAIILDTRWGVPRYIGDADLANKNNDKYL